MRRSDGDSHVHMLCFEILRYKPEVQIVIVGERCAELADVESTRLSALFLAYRYWCGHMATGAVGKPENHTQAIGTFCHQC